MLCARRNLLALFWGVQVEFYPHHGYLNISLTVWLGIYLFFIIERCLKIFMDHKARQRGEQGASHHHHHSHSHPGKELENLLSTSPQVGTENPATILTFYLITTLPCHQLFVLLAISRYYKA